MAPIETIEQSQQLLVVYTWPLSAVIKDGFLKIFCFSTWKICVQQVQIVIDKFTIPDNHIKNE